MSTAMPILIAAFVAVVGFRGWITSHQKLMLDLFDRRFAAYTEIVGSVHAIILGASLEESHPTMVRYAEAAGRARFLYGPEVMRFVDDVYERLNYLRGLQRKHRDVRDDLRPALGDEIAAIENDLRLTNDRMIKLVDPYMALRMRAPGHALREWWPW